MWSYITEPEDVDDESEGSQELAAQPSEVEYPPESEAVADTELPDNGSAVPSKGSKLPHQAYDMYKRYVQRWTLCSWVWQAEL